MKRFYVCLTLLAAFLSCSSSVYEGGNQHIVPGGDDSRSETQWPEEYDVFLLIGQSNMAGRGTMLPEDKERVMNGVWLLNGEDVPEPAKNPLNRYSTVRKSLNQQQISPGTAFGERVAAATGRRVLIVMNALGGSGIQYWLPTADPVPNTGGVAGNIASENNLQLYAEAVRRAKEAQKYGTLRGILWHQGEANSGASSVATYLDNLKKIVDGLREDLGEPDVPFIAGELAYWRGGGTGSDAFNAMIRTISEVIPHTGWVSAAGATWLKDASDPHFSRDGQILLGTRYADKALEMCFPDDRK